MAYVDPLIFGLLRIRPYIIIVNMVLRVKVKVHEVDIV